MGFWKNIASFFKNFGKNVIADPVSSVKGIVQVAAGAAACYGMATGVVPVNTGAPVAAGFISSGLHSLGTNTLGVEALGKAAPVVNDTVAQYKALQSEAAVAKVTLDKFHAVTSALEDALKSSKGDPAV